HLTNSVAHITLAICSCMALARTRAGCCRRLPMPEARAQAHDATGPRVINTKVYLLDTLPMDRSNPSVSCLSAGRSCSSTLARRAGSGGICQGKSTFRKPSDRRNAQRCLTSSASSGSLVVSESDPLLLHPSLKVTTTDTVTLVLTVVGKAT